MLLNNIHSFIRLVLKLWSGNEYSQKLKDRQLIFICEGKAYLLTSVDGDTTQTIEIPTLHSTQEETDTRVVLYARYAMGCQKYKNVRVKLPESDIFFILLYFAESLSEISILFDTRIGNKPRLININKLGSEYGPSKCAALLGLHGFTGCDSTSAFHG